MREIAQLASMVREKLDALVWTATRLQSLLYEEGLDEEAAHVSAQRVQAEVYARQITEWSRSMLGKQPNEEYWNPTDWLTLQSLGSKSEDLEIVLQRCIELYRMMGEIHLEMEDLLGASVEE